MSLEAEVWRDEWQDDRKSTSGGIVMMGAHPIKTWSSTQGSVALSSAEAEFYAMVDAVLKAKWMATLAQEMGFKNMMGKLVSDSSAAKSFVSRRGRGKMRHIEVLDLWLQKEIMKGLVKVVKILGEEEPGDLMTKFLHVDVIRVT